MRPGRTGIQAGGIAFGEHAGVKLWLISPALAESCSNRVVHIAIKFIEPGWGIVNGNRYDKYLIANEIEVIPAIWPHSYIQGKEVPLPVTVYRVGFFGADHAFVAPIAQVVYRG